MVSTQLSLRDAAVCLAEDATDVCFELHQGALHATSLSSASGSVGATCGVQTLWTRLRMVVALDCCYCDDADDDDDCDNRLRTFLR